MKKRAFSAMAVGGGQRNALMLFILGLVLGVSIGYFSVASSKYMSKPGSETSSRPWKPGQISQPQSSLRDLIERDIGLALLTTDKPGYQDKNVPILYKTWLKGFEDLVDVVSDSDNNTAEGGVKIYNHLNAARLGCSSTDKQFGLICKNNIMFQKWMFDPASKSKKWYFRFMDDTWAHLGNLYDLVSKLDHTVPYVIGDKWCHRDGWTYPSGGPGIIFSRGFFDVFNLTEWAATPAKFISTVDDVSMGGYLKNMGVVLMHHYGINQYPPFWPGSGAPVNTLEKMVEAQPWNWPWRPIAWHMSGHSENIYRLHDMLGNLDYETKPGVEILPFPPCFCYFPDYHRCIAQKSKIKDCAFWHYDCHF